VTDNLFNQGLIPVNQVGIYFAPTTQQSVQNGELTYGTFILADFLASRLQRRSGGTDSSKYTGTISYTPVTTTSPASRYWGINQSIRYGPSTAILSTTAGIVDTGSSSFLFWL
jgi:cathepsin E